MPRVVDRFVAAVGSTCSAWGMTFTADLVARARDASSLVPDAERDDARRVVFIGGLLVDRPRDETGHLAPDAGDAALRIELNRLAELLGRRSSHAIPFAAMARAAMADLAGDTTGRAERLGEADRHLSMRGL